MINYYDMTNAVHAFNSASAVCVGGGGVSIPTLSPVSAVRQMCLRAPLLKGGGA